MSKEVISISAIVDLMVQGKNISRENAEEYIRVLLSCVEDALIEGETVKIKGLGVFRTVWQDVSEHITEDKKITEAGFYQIAFTPEDSFKSKVNEPFSHLEPVTINVKDENKESINEPEEKLDTFQLFEEQATEIKDLLNEIKALSVEKEKSSIENTSNLDNTSNEEKKLEEENPKTNDSENNSINTEQTPNTQDDNFEVVRIIYEDHPEVIKRKQEKREKKQIKEETAKTPNKNNVPKEHQDNNILVSPTIDSTNITVKDTKDNKIPHREENKDTTDEDSKKRKTLLYILISILAVVIVFAIAYFLPFIKQKQKLKREKEQIERIADSLANEKRFIAIQDSIIRLRNNSGNRKTEQEDSILPEKKKPEPTPKKENTNTLPATEIAKPSSTFNFTAPRKYNKIIGTETMKVGSKLTKFAQDYYGHANFWVYIYEANKDKIKDPDNIPAGAELKIPELDKRLIDIKNPKTIEYAKELQSKYLNR